MSSGPGLRFAQTSIQWVPEALSAGLKLQGREADSPHPTNAEVTNTWIYTSAPLYVFMA
jgi:hypothetical protein